MPTDWVQPLLIAGVRMPGALGLAFAFSKRGARRKTHSSQRAARCEATESSDVEVADAGAGRVQRCGTASGEARRRDIGRRRAAHHPWSDAHTGARGGARNPLQTSSPPLSALVGGVEQRRRAPYKVGWYRPSVGVPETLDGRASGVLVFTPMSSVGFSSRRVFNFVFDSRFRCEVLVFLVVCSRVK